MPNRAVRSAAIGRLLEMGVHSIFQTKQAKLNHRRLADAAAPNRKWCER